jgi:hypothetical protein
MNLFEATEILIQNIKNPSTAEDDYSEDTALFVDRKEANFKFRRALRLK